MAGGELEQIQLPLRHASIETTERYLGNQQDPRPGHQERPDEISGRVSLSDLGTRY
jgi:hypothetical protein